MYTVSNASHRTLAQIRKTLRRGLHAPCPAFRVRDRTPPWTKRMPQARKHGLCAAMRTLRGTSFWRVSCDGLWTFTSDGARVCFRLRCIAPHATGSGKHWTPLRLHPGASLPPPFPSRVDCCSLSWGGLLGMMALMSLHFFRSVALLSYYLFSLRQIRRLGLDRREGVPSWGQQDLNFLFLKGTWATCVSVDM